MKVKDIIRIANDAYGGNEVKRAYEAEECVGDPLAYSITTELEDCWGDEAEIGEYEQLGQALSQMEVARDKLCDVCDALSKAQDDILRDEDWCRRNPGVDPCDPRI
jgi:hypothetical protein